MSQIYKSLTAGPVPPAVPTSFVTDINSPSVPIANIENVFGGFVTTDDADGIQTDGSSGSNTLTIQLTNRLRGSGSTVGAVTTDLVTFSLGATPGTYVIDANFCAFEPTTPAGAGYSLFGSVRTTGAAAFLVGTPDKINNEDASLIACNADIVVSGNNAILRVTGTAGLTIDWVVLATYVKVT
jgi:hypothetical protein